MQIYGEGGLVATVNAPRTGSGVYWEVCTLDGATGKVTVINRYAAVKPAGLGTGPVLPEPASGTIRKLGVRAVDMSEARYQWGFGDGTSSQEKNPVKTYSQPGAYDVGLTVRLAGFQSGYERKVRYVTAGSTGVSLSVTDASSLEGNSRGNSLRFSVRLSKVSAAVVTVDYATADETAVAGSDYEAVQGTLVFNPGETNKTVLVPILGDLLPEADETLLLNLANPVNADLGDAQGIGYVIDDDLLPGMAWINPGTFMMGSPATEKDRFDDEGPQTRVTLTKGFWMGKYEVTQEEYMAVMGNNPSYFTGDLKRPVEMVSWADATNYCGKLTHREKQIGRLPAGYEYRLPTEAEWEYVCRAGTTTRFSYGDDLDYKYLGDYAWYLDNSGNTTHRVGQKAPNPWGLYDMHGNAWEWCLDWYASSLPGGSVIDPQGPATGSIHGSRGGGWDNVAQLCRSAFRLNIITDPDFRRSHQGFRLVLAQDITVHGSIIITRQPEDQTVEAGTNVTLRVEATGPAPLGYQWYFNATNVITDATNTILVLSNLRINDAGNYTVVVSGPFGGSVTSRVAVVQVVVRVSVPGMVWINPGAFTMGSPSTEKDRGGGESPQTRVTLTKGFWMGKYEVTQEEYLAVMGTNPSNFTGDLKCPVEMVSWDNATNYCGKLTQRERLAGRLPAGYEYRLPTEAEWEYVCRAGTTTRFSYGDDLDYKYLGDYAWYLDNSGNTTHRVGQKAPNPWGLYDMHGNAWEWCSDWYANSLPGGNVTDPGGPISGSYRMARGGGWYSGGGYCRSAGRVNRRPDPTSNGFGFRPVLAQDITVHESIVITRQPEDQVVEAGTNVTLRVEVTGPAPLRYQWWKDGFEISGRTNSTLVLSNVRTNDAGSYTVVVTGPFAGSVTSRAAAVQVFVQVPVPEMVWINPGTFMMGSPATEKDRKSGEGPQTQMTITHGFYMGKYEVTQEEYMAVMGSNPSYFTGDLKRPVEMVSWADATNYCGKLTQRERQAERLPAGYEYRLPTEAEWEYVCRAGTTTRFSYGDDLDYKYLGDYAWYLDNSGNTTHRVGQKAPNPWGLYDMHGNAWEWCLDWYGSSLPGGSVIDPQGPATGLLRVLRSGGWSGDGWRCRSALRLNSWPDLRGGIMGFRLVLAPGQS